MTQAPIAYRRMTPADIEACADVLDEADNDLNSRRGLPQMPRNRTALLKMLERIALLHPDRSWVATSDDVVVGYGQAVSYADLTFLSFLFVLPDHQDRGIGRELMERAMDGGAYRGVCINSVQPISAALYARHGMAPRVPIFMFLDRPLQPLPRLSAGIRLRPMSMTETSDLDRDVCGFERPLDHEWWEQFGRVRYGVYAGGSAVGYGYVQDSGRLGPVVVRQPKLVLPLLGELMAQMPTVEAWMVNVPGPASEAFVGLLRAGMRLEGPPAIFCATDLRVDHSRYLPASFALP